MVLQQVQQFINLDYRTTSDNKTLLHLSLMECHNSICADIPRRFPYLPVVQLLLSCRVPINAIDCHHYTPLHDLAMNKFENSTNEELDNIKAIFKLLINAGAHLDANAQGKTPEDCVEHEKLKSLFRRYPIQLSLKCLCARMIQKKKLNYIDCIPKHLHAFIKIH